MSEKIDDLVKRIDALPIENQLLLAAQLFTYKGKEALAITLAENAVMTWQAEQRAKKAGARAATEW